MSKTLNNYPVGLGGRRVSVIQHPGPASYVQAVAANPTTGGMEVTVSEAAFKEIDYIAPGTSDDGIYLALPIFNNLNTAPKAGAQTLVRCKVLVISTMAEVAAAVDLSGRIFRFFALGQ